MKTNEKFLASRLFEKLIKTTFGVKKVKVRNSISALTRWYSQIRFDDSTDYDIYFKVHALSSIGFTELDVVNTTNYYDEGKSEKNAKYSCLADSLIAQAPEAILIVEVCYVKNDYLEFEDNYAIVYNVPNL